MSAQIDPHELHAWLRLSMEPGLGAAASRQLLSAFGMPQNIFDASAGSLSAWLETGLAVQLSQPPSDGLQEQIGKALAWLQGGESRRLITLADSQYPPGLLQLKDPPLLLYALGNPDCLLRPAISVVGARHASHEGLGNAHAFAGYLARKGWCVISGLASGIDGAAHRGALQAGDSGGSTIAVLGTGIDRIYPAGHQELARQIATQGLMLSEFPPGSRALPYHFPKRNRLVAALGQGVLVVEAATRSGSLITARMAGDMGREVFAIPGSIHSPLSRGCHALIRQGAKLVESGQDILEELQQAGLPLAAAASHATADSRPHEPDTAPVTSPASAPAPVSFPATAPVPEMAAGDSSRQIKALLRALGHNPASMDELVQRTGWQLPGLMALVSRLEMAGALQRLPNGLYQRQPRSRRSTDGAGP